MGYGVSLVPEALRTNSVAIDGTYRVIGSPLTHPVRYIKFQNLSTQSVYISWNGIHDHMILPANSFDVIDIATNKQKTDAGFISKGTQFWVRQVGAAPVGNVYISVLYGYGDN